MTMFWDALQTHAFLQYALLAGLLVSIPCGVVGSFVVIRRISYIAGGIAHSVLAGLGIVHYLQVVHGLEGLSPLGGAVIAALIAALVIGGVMLFRAMRRRSSGFPSGGFGSRAHLGRLAAHLVELRLQLRLQHPQLR